MDSMNHANTNCSVLIFSCDVYADLWNSFFYLLKKHWSNCPYPVYLSTESKEFQCADMDIQVIHTGPGEWSARALKALQQIDTEYLIIGLDDFFLYLDVDQQRLGQCIEWMEDNADVVNFSFAPTLWPDVDDGRFPGFERRPVHAEYRVNLQMGLWRKDIFKKLLRAHENVWQFEIFGSSRANRHKKWAFYAAQKNVPRVFTYEFGGALHQGKWTAFTKKMLEENGLDIDWSIRGFDPKPTSEWEKLLPPPEKRPFYSHLGRRIKKILKNWRSYI